MLAKLQRQELNSLHIILNLTQKMSAFELFSHFTTKLASMRNLQSRLEHYEDSFALKKYRLGEISI